MDRLLYIRPVYDEDVKLIENWINQEYILKWFKSSEEWIKEIKARFGEFSFIKHFIVMYDNMPIGFCQYYDCLSANEIFHPEILIIGTFSIDYLIGEEEYLRKGIGKAIIKLIIHKIFNETEAERIVVKPEKENLASCNSLRTNNFEYDEENDLYHLSKSDFLSKSDLD
ncbi:GNAT family N-acetyltransferase [Clostridioides sp. GD02377]|uniref:GNAT family N-acetyltransferase n=1 Tax=unclassified Clostridioides TaxID=2635829 RepID=UPI0038A01D50